MKEIAIFVSKTAGVDEVCAAYALADYLTYQKDVKIDEHKEYIHAFRAYVFRSDDDEWTAEAKNIADNISSVDVNRRSEELYTTPDVKISIGVYDARQFGEKRAEVWGRLMEVEHYIIRPGKFMHQTKKRNFLQKKAPLRNYCTEMIYDYIDRETKGNFTNNNVIPMLYRGIYWNTNHFVDHLSDDTFEMIHCLLSSGYWRNDLKALNAIFDKPEREPMSTIWYGSILSTAKENDHALICHQAIENTEVGKKVIKRLAEDFHKDLILFYGNVKDEIAINEGESESPVEIFCYLKDGAFPDETFIHTGASSILTKLTDLKSRKIRSKDSRFAWATLAVGMKEVANILEEQILKPTNRNMALLKASLA